MMWILVVYLWSANGDMVVDYDSSHKERQVCRETANNYNKAKVKKRFAICLPLRTKTT